MSCFKKDIRQELDKKDQWCYFIKNAGRLSRDQLILILFDFQVSNLPYRKEKPLKRHPFQNQFGLLSTKGEDMAKAVGLFDNVSVRDLEWLRKRTEEREHWDRISMQAEARKKARREGHAEGKAEGHAEGKAEGHAEGKAEGHAQGKAEGHAQGKAEGMEKERQVVALNMLKEQVDMRFICKVTGMSEEEINKLKSHTG